ncbi:acyl-CoA dehydrogenase family protein [Acidiferrimicrobium sp. IK]|uniref:acyl-CoA dehydrogenase family protein n=1 Tax=Acidiferrimicrobium sp. IK TaxID=2871700 RepID=UPI0021CB7D14|nr:acyl-CoA dehydrogenase family protein [Acidiferrimicrobium sp. IK]MCU4183441.1 acyl-CoA dehydrogenase family protein [Acidiferrimicrobium sp. IK]
MNFEWTAEEQAFREAVRDAIARYGSPEWGPRDFELTTPELAETCRAFCRALAKEGLLTPNWPKEYGGRDASPWEQLILSEEMHGAFEPRGPQYMNVNWIGPAIMAYGTPRQKELHLPLIANGDVFWCQGFSEPDAGSDLSAMRTAAVRDGDTYVVNGQKIWTSYAHAADYCFLLARTDPTAEARRGISALLVPMDSAGIEVRTIPNIAGAHVIHEVFFRDVHVDASCLLGAENDGWALVLNSLANERIGIARFERSARALDAAVANARQAGRPFGPCEKELAGRALAYNEVARVLNYAAVQERISAGEGPRPAASISRVATVTAIRRTAETSLELLGQPALVDPEADEQLATATTVAIAAGSYEMQLNNVARLSLNLPKG